MNHFIGELLGTFILVLLGDGVVGGNVLKGTKEEGTGWNAIAIGWGIAIQKRIKCTEADGACDAFPMNTHESVRMWYNDKVVLVY